MKDICVGVIFIAMWIWLMILSHVLGGTRKHLDLLAQRVVALQYVQDVLTQEMK